MNKLHLFILLLVFIISSCKKIDDLTPQSRSFYMGFQPWAHDINHAATLQAYNNIAVYGDIISMQLDMGIPWEQAYNKETYPEDVVEELNERKSLIPPNTKIFLSVMPLSLGRDDIAEYWGQESDEIKRKWAAKSFADTMVISAFLNYSRDMIAFFDPDYFCYTVEANASFTETDPKYHDFLIFCDTVYNTLKSEYPDLPIMLSLVTNFLGGDYLETTTKQLLQYSDYIAISSYPFLLPHALYGDANPQRIPKDWFRRIVSYAPDKPVCVSETGYIAEDLELHGFHIDLRGREEWQAEYVQWLFTEMNDLNAEFVIWFTARDYNYAGEKLEGIVPPAYYIWIDTGIQDEDGFERPSAKIWKQWKSIPRINKAED